MVAAEVERLDGHSVAGLERTEYFQMLLDQRLPPVGHPTISLDQNFDLFADCGPGILGFVLRPGPARPGHFQHKPTLAFLDNHTFKYAPEPPNSLRQPAGGTFAITVAFAITLTFTATITFTFTATLTFTFTATIAFTFATTIAFTFTATLTFTFAATITFTFTAALTVTSAFAFTGDTGRATELSPEIGVHAAKFAQFSFHSDQPGSDIRQDLAQFSHLVTTIGSDPAVTITYNAASFAFSTTVAFAFPFAFTFPTTVAFAFPFAFTLTTTVAFPAAVALTLAFAIAFSFTTAVAFSAAVALTLAFAIAFSFAAAVAFTFTFVLAFTFDSAIALSLAVFGLQSSRRNHHRRQGSQQDYRCVLHDISPCSGSRGSLSSGLRLLFSGGARRSSSSF